MGAVKDAKLLRENFAKEKQAKAAMTIKAEKAEVCVTEKDYNQGKRIKNFTLVIHYKDGLIEVPITMEQLKRWEKEIKEIGLAMWFHGQKLEHYSHHSS